MAPGGSAAGGGADSAESGSSGGTDGSEGVDGSGEVADGSEGVDGSGEVADGSGGVAPHATALADGIEAVLEGWVVRCVAGVMAAWRGAVPAEVRAAAEEAGRRCRIEVGPAVRALLQADIDEQRGTPLAVLRGAVRYPTDVLAAAGVPGVVRDSFAERSFPADVYNLTPASFADVDPSLSDLGIAWGAAKAFEHMRRHRS